MLTSNPKPEAPGWFVADAKGQTLGRLAASIAHVLRGKHKPTYSPNVVSGDHVIVINASGLVLQGKKAEQKEYFTHSGYLGNMKRIPFARLFAKDPAQVMSRAVKGMLPRNKLRAKMLAQLHIFPGSEHPHEAQKPQPLSTILSSRHHG